MRFKIKIISAGEVKWAGQPDRGPVYYGGPPPESGSWKLDMNRLEDYIDKEVGNASFGESIELFIFWFEIAELAEWGNFFTSTHNYMSYRPKMKALITVGQLNWPDVKDLDEQAQFKCFVDAILAAVERVKQMKRKPRQFDVERFLDRLRSILATCPVSGIAVPTV